MSISDFANHACRVLPKGWTLRLEMEDGAGWFALNDPNGDDIDSEEFCSVDDAIEIQGHKAIGYAIANARGLIS